MTKEITLREIIDQGFNCYNQETGGQLSILEHVESDSDFDLKFELETFQERKVAGVGCDFYKIAKGLGFVFIKKID